MNAKEWWHPILADKEYFKRLRKNYPENAHMTDEELHDYYCDGQKYSTTWDHVGDAYAEYEKLADAYLDLLAKQEEAYKIAYASPELNMSNYNESDVSGLNDAMCEVCCILEPSTKQ